jgi:hypothetical protein
MQISLKHLLELPNLDSLQIPIDASSLEKSIAYTVEDGEVIKHAHLTMTFGYQLLKKQVDKISIIPGTSLLQDILTLLREKHPGDYPKPTAMYSVRDLATLIPQYEEMNNYSEKVREIYILQELLAKPHPVTKQQQIIFQYNTRLNPKIVEKLQSLYPESEKFDCLETENGVLLVTISKDQQDTLNTIMAATDLVARLEKHFKLDLAYSREEAIDKFKFGKPRLVVYGNYKFKSDSGAEEINDKARSTYLELRNIDIFCKSLFINQVNLEENKEKLAGEIMAAYKQPYNITKSESKIPLSDDEKKKYLSLLEKLNKNYTREEYLKLSIQIKTLEQVHLVSFIKNQLLNIHKLHIGPKA